MLQMYEFLSHHLQLQGKIAPGWHQFQYICFQKSENRFENNGTKQIQVR